jgi:hypothetical protein
MAEEAARWTDPTAGQRRRRPVLGVGAAVGAAFAAALIGLANAPAARADTEPDPFEDLFGTAGINSWTASADSFLVSSDPALAANLGTSVDNFEAAAHGLLQDVAPTSELVYQFDPNSFTPPDAGFLFETCVIACPTFPLDSTDDFALGLDYSIFVSGLGPTLDPLIDDFTQALYFPEQFLGLLLLLFG